MPASCYFALVFWHPVKNVLKNCCTVKFLEILWSSCCPPGPSRSVPGGMPTRKTRGYSCGKPIGVGRSASAAPQPTPKPALLHPLPSGICCQLGPVHAAHPSARAQPNAHAAPSADLHGDSRTPHRLSLLRAPAPPAPLPGCPALPALRCPQHSRSWA